MIPMMTIAITVSNKKSGGLSICERDAAGKGRRPDGQPGDGVIDAEPEISSANGRQHYPGHRFGVRSHAVDARR